MPCHPDATRLTRAEASCLKKDRRAAMDFFYSLAKVCCGDEHPLDAMRYYFVYILTNRARTLYIGVTNDLLRRMEEHRGGLAPGFTSKYKIHRLVYFEQFNDVALAIAREKDIKGWLRQKKIDLIETVNSKWSDLSREF
jgi:putative endonuclease